jgi:hypothetical protein
MRDCDGPSPVHIEQDGLFAYSNISGLGQPRAAPALGMFAAGRKRSGVRGAHLNPLGLFLYAPPYRLYGVF